MPSGSTLSVAPAALLLIVSPFPRNIFFTLKTSGSANAARRRGGEAKPFDPAQHRAQDKSTELRPTPTPKIACESFNKAFKHER
jgi:hypothetical protein